MKRRKRRDLVNEEETARYRTLVEEADTLLFIYPIWWWGMPAILKGFIDRIFVAGFAYKYEGTLPKGLLKGKKAWVINTLDSPLWYVALLYRSADWIIMKRGVLRFCGIHDIKRSVFQSVKTSKREKREKWLLQIEEKGSYTMNEMERIIKCCGDDTELLRTYITCLLQLKKCSENV